MKQTTITAISLAILVVAASCPGATPYSKTHVATYLTAQATDQRLAPAGQAELAGSPPVVEKEEYISLIPQKLFKLSWASAGH